MTTKRNRSREFPIRIALTLIIVIAASQAFGQVGYPFMSPTIDSICRSTLEYVQLKQLLMRQQEQVKREMEQIENALQSLNIEHSDILQEREVIDKELASINHHLDSLTPKRPPGPRPKENIIDILNERTSFHGNYGVNLNQLALSNWAAGGENNATGKAFLNLYFSYRNKKSEQILSGEFAFGTSRFTNKRFEKSDDKIEVKYSVGPVSKTQWSFTMLTTFKTQFAEGYKYPDDSTMLSCFMAPAYFTLSFGGNYRTKNENFHIYLSPFASKATFVINQELADKGSYGVKKGYYDEDGNWVPGEHAVGALGVELDLTYKQPIGKSINYATSLNVFYNYYETNRTKYFPIDFNWENTINFVISKHLSTVLFLHLKYDHNTTFPIYAEIDGVQTVVDKVPKLQIKESLGIAFIHKF